MDAAVESVSIDEVPRFWFSRRWRTATLCCVALLITTSQRISIDVALHSMLNHSAVAITAAADTNIRSLSPHHSPLLLLPSGGDNMTTTAADAAPHSTNPCFNASRVGVFTTKIFEYQDKGDIVWTTEQISGIMDAFHYGDLVGRLPGGLLSQRYGGKRLLGLALLVTSLCTALVPLTARFHFSLVVLLRFIAGSTAGATCPAVSYLLGRWSPPDERSLLFSIANTGTLMCGSAVLIPLAGLLCEYGFDGGWPSVFYVFGGLGMAWFIVWMLLTADEPLRDSGMSCDEKDYITASLTSIRHDAEFDWPVALTSLSTLTLVLCQFTYDWVVFVIGRDVPAYFRQFLSLDIQINTVCAILPGAAFWCVMMSSAGAADRLRTYGVLNAVNTRAVCHAIGAVMTSSMLASLAGLTDCSAAHWAGPLSMLVISTSFCGVQLGAGALVFHLDLASRHAGVIAAVTGTVGASTYFVVPAFRRILRAAIQSELVQWRTLFISTACLHVLSASFFVLLAASHRTRQHSPSPQAPPNEDPAIDHEAPPTVRHDSSGPPLGDVDLRSAVDSETEYGSADESVSPVSDSGHVPRSLNADRDLHLAQLMESIL